MAKITGGEVLKRCLVQENVRYVFGVCGAQFLPFLDAIYKDERIEFIGTRHEAAAAHAADAWTRVTGKPGVCIGTVGPGAANLVAGVYPPSADSIPVIAITAQNQTWRSYPDHGSTQGLDQISLFKGVTKWNAVISHWERIPELVHQAFRIATSGRPGPVHLDFPSDVMFQAKDENEVKTVPPKSYRSIARPVGDISLIEQAAKMLGEAKLPLIHAGGGVLRSEASEELIQLAEYLQAPVTTSVQGKGAIPEDHPLCLISNCFGTGGLVVQADADVVLLVGGRLADLEFWGQPPLWGDPAQQKLIQIDISGDMIGLNRLVDIGIVGDAKSTLRALLEALKKHTPKKEERESLQSYKQVEKDWLEGFKEMCDSDSVPIHPARLVKEAREFFPRDAIAVSDGGNTSVWCVRLNRIYEPNTFLSCSSGDAGHLGAGIPYAIAAKLAAPSKQVYCITGDGSFGLNIQELETASRLQLPIVFIVHNDSAWGMIKGGQTASFGKRYIGVDLGDVRYDEIARGMNCYGERVVKPSEIKSALQRAVDSKLPAVLDVIIDKEVLPSPDLEACVAQWLEGCGG